MAGSGMKEKEREGAEMAESKEAVVYMWGYLPGVSPEKSPILSPVLVQLPDLIRGRDSWKEVSGGGCGFAVAISESGKLITWGSADDEVQSYLTSGKHGENPEAFHLPTDAPAVKAAVGWAHCVSVTETGEVYTWGWKECVPSGKVFLDLAAGGGFVGETAGKQGSTELGSPRTQGSNLTGEADSQQESKRTGEEIAKRRKISPAKQEPESPTSREEFFSTSPCLVTMGPGVKITSVAAGGRHTLALSDMGQVWGWGYGGEGQLGLGSRVKMVSSPHVIPCIEPTASVKDMSSVVQQGTKNGSAHASKAPGNYVKEIACGGRHSAVITDAGALLTFGWGLYGQCGQGNTNDLLKPTFVASLSGTRVERIAAGLWHTLCTTVDGRVYAFGGNQFGQLGTGAPQAEILPRLLDSPSLESKHARIVSCGARHSAMLTEDGQLFGWGWNKYGQLGLGDSIDRNTPSRVAIGECLPRNVSCGWWHTLMLAEAPV